LGVPHFRDCDVLGFLSNKAVDFLDPTLNRLWLDEDRGTWFRVGAMVTGGHRTTLAAMAISGTILNVVFYFLYLACYFLNSFFRW